MAIVAGYATLAEIKQHFGLAGSDANNALLERAVEASSRAIDRFCGRRFWQDSSPTARVYRADDPTEITVDDIASTTGLAIATDTTDDGTFDTTWASSDYQLEPLNADVNDGAYAWWRILAIDERAFPTGRGRARVQVTATHGWSAVPDEITEACLIKAARLFRRKDTPDGVAGFAEFGIVRVSRIEDPDVALLLEPFVKVDVRAVI